MRLRLDAETEPKDITNIEKLVKENFRQCFKVRF